MLPLPPQEVATASATQPFDRSCLPENGGGGEGDGEVGEPINLSSKKKYRRTEVAFPPPIPASCVTIRVWPHLPKAKPHASSTLSRIKVQQKRLAAQRCLLF
jgi:hypothetical protein